MAPEDPKDYYPPNQSYQQPPTYVGVTSHRDHNQLKYLVIAIGIMLGLIAFLGKDKIETVDRNISRLSQQTSVINDNQIKVETRLNYIQNDVQELSEDFKEVKDRPVFTDNERKRLEQDLDIKLERMKLEIQQEAIK